MTYIPIKTITIKNNRLVESVDLTKPLSSFIKGEHYLVLERNKALSCVSINTILTNIAGLDLSKQIGTVFTNLLSDLFVNRFINKTIPVQHQSGLYPNRLVVFNPLAYKDFKVFFTSINTPEIRDDVTKKGFLDDLAIVSDQDMSHFLVAVNGVFHHTTILNGVLYVLDGFRTVRLSGRKDIVVVDTKDIGGHTIVPLTSANVTKPDYQKNAVITSPVSVQGKSVFAVIDGYFYHRDQAVLSVGDKNHLVLHTNKLPLIQQFRHNPRTITKLDRFGLDASQTSRKYEDSYESVFLGNSTVPSETLANKDFQYSRLTAYHSFLVVMNNPNLFTVATQIMSTGTPKLYQDLSYRQLSGMLNYGCGLCPSYLMWRDVHDRKSIFLSDQDNDVDRQDDSINPLFIPALLKEPEKGVDIPATFVDYVCA